MALKAVIIRCPNCNAILEIASTVTSVKCSYCDVVSRIQAKTMMFQVPPALPQQPQQRQAQLQQIQQLTPVPKNQTGMVGVWVGLMVTLGMGVVAYQLVATRPTRIAGAPGRSAVASPNASAPGWGGQRPVLLDADGDGVRDIIGFTRYVMDGDRMHLAAFSGVTGTLLWESERLGTYSDLTQVKLARLGGLVLLATERGAVTARDSKTGKQAWATSFDEKIDVFCAAGASAVVVRTADDKWTRLDDKGAQSPGPKLARLDAFFDDKNARKRFDAAGVESTDVCIPVGEVWGQSNGMLSLEHMRILTIEGMNVDRLVRRPGDPATIAIGSKTPGTAVPMVARINGNKTLWTSPLPAVDPLTARFENSNFALSDRAIFALYTTSGPEVAHLTALDIATGKRLWDREITSSSLAVTVGLTANADTVMLTTWMGVRVFNAADGSDKFTIGSR